MKRYTLYFIFLIAFFACTEAKAQSPFPKDECGTEQEKELTLPKYADFTVEKTLYILNPFRVGGETCPSYIDSIEHFLPAHKYNNSPKTRWIVQVTWISSKFYKDLVATGINLQNKVL